MVTLHDDPAPDAVAQALRALARDVGDPYRMADATLARALGAGTAAVLAEAGGAPVGVAVYVVFPSTTRGLMGAFVTDLWVAEAARGTGLGRALLARVRDRVAADWGGGFLRLNYFADNPGAAGFYTALGFRPMPGETWVTLEGAALAALSDRGATRP